MTDFMVQELVNERHYAHIFKRITRYTLKAPGIILDRHALPPTGEPTIDPNGEWMKCEQLNNIIMVGGLIEYTSDLQERLLDGDAQRGLMRDIGNLGYEDFDQVMVILKNNRHQLIDQRKFEIWTEGYQATGEHQKAVKHATIEAFSFHEAVVKYIATLEPDTAKHWRHDKDTNTWFMWGCQAYDNETDVRKSFG